jgi:hypothetical protein
MYKGRGGMRDTFLISCIVLIAFGSGGLLGYDLAGLDAEIANVTTVDCSIVQAPWVNSCAESCEVLWKDNMRDIAIRTIKSDLINKGIINSN